MLSKFQLTILGTILIFATSTEGRTVYLDSKSGKNSNDGKSAETAWKSLSKAKTLTLQPGDALRLKRGSWFTGTLKLTATGTAEQPITIDCYGSGPLPVINSKGLLAGVNLLDSHHVKVSNLKIISDGGKTLDGGSRKLRYGAYVHASADGSSSNITLEKLTIDRIFPELPSEHEGHLSTTHLGTAIALHGNRNSPSTHLWVRDCKISTTGFQAIDLKHLRHVHVLDNHMKDIGGPAIQPGHVDDIIVRGNTVDGSGSSADPRMHQRGSGIWPWTCKRVLIEKNTFRHARGKADSCGIHIDFNCRDVIVQYNLSHDNEGGFIEILGNNHNCAYRYNISINDGSRALKKNGATQEGKILWTSGYVGKKQTKKGPYNSYIYNNTIYVGPNSRSCFSISSTTKGLLVANNIFHIMGTTENVLGDQDWRKDKAAKKIANSRVQNNLYVRDSVLPPDLPLKERNKLVGDPNFRKPGGTEALDYTPRNISLIKDQGISIPSIDGDKIGLSIGLAVTVDFFGNPVQGPPDLGAIELP